MTIFTAPNNEQNTKESHVRKMKKFLFTILLASVALTGQAQVNTTTALLASWSGKLNVGAMISRLFISLM